ncbi:flagellin [Clostridium tagluense]|uniref:flagellin n=1 Tax=Clostridium tagluense TaxID=360422 RepID=UPI001C6EC939|nr:flagellin [Clostridium tagluense]MBW9154958.1 flagellin [Clostridium tagluense]WLC64411.1 flagellin [Clostridium tagluense]
MRVQGYNILSSLNSLSKNIKNSSESIGKVSSGKRINRASDDAAGLCISESFKSQVRGLSQAERNIQDGVSMLQVADGAMGEITDCLHRMKELSVKGANGTLINKDKEMVDSEFQQLKKGIDDIASNTEFNTIKLLNENKDVSIQTKDRPYTTYMINLFDVSTNSLRISDASVSNYENAQDSISKIDNALENITSHRVSIGADSNSLQHAYNDTSNSNYNLTASLSRIEDINMATYIMKFTKDNVITQYSEMIATSSKQNAESANALLNKWFNT